MIIYIKDCVFQNLVKLGGVNLMSSKDHFLPYAAWRVNLTPLTISPGKVRNGPQMVLMDGKQVILTNETV